MNGFLLIIVCIQINCENDLIVDSVWEDEGQCRLEQKRQYKANKTTSMCVRDIDNSQWRNWE